MFVIIFEVNIAAEQKQA